MPYMKHKTVLLTLFKLLLLATVAAAQETAQPTSAIDGCPFIKIVPERLPDLHIARFSHATFYAGGELTVTGGHTTSFVPTPTAEYLKDGQWHVMQMAYNHDDGLCVPLRNGKVLLAGGYEKNLGVGQTIEAEMYDPASHTFNGFGCLDRKRVHVSGIEMPGGQVVAAGNWYHDDAIETYDGGMYFKTARQVSVHRSMPYLLCTSDSDLMVVNGCWDNYGKPIQSTTVDRLKGEPFDVPLLETWRPYLSTLAPHADHFFIGDMKKGIFAYLLPVQNANGQVAIMEVRDTLFSLLPTEYPIPTKGPYGPIKYDTPVLADRQMQLGYIMGTDSTGRKYILSFEYAKRPASMTLYYTDPLPNANGSQPVLTPDGHLITAGGINLGGTYFTPSKDVWLFPVGQPAATEAAKGGSYWTWILLAVLLLGAVGTTVWLYWRKRRNKAAALVTEVASEAFDNMPSSAVVVLPEGVSTSDDVTNVVNGDGTCAEMNLTDVGNLTLPIPVTAEVIIYERTISQYTSVCFPFETPIPEGMKAFELVSDGEGQAHFVESEDNPLQAYKPYILVAEEDLLAPSFGRRAEGALETVLNLSVTDVVIDTSHPIETVEKGSFKLFGTITGLTHAEGIEKQAYIMQDDFSWQMTAFSAPWMANEQYLPPFYTYMCAEGETPLENINTVIDSGVTSIKVPSTLRSQASDGWYDLSGRRLTDKPAKKGVYIRNGRKIAIK